MMKIKAVYNKQHERLVKFSMWLYKILESRSRFQDLSYRGEKFMLTMVAMVCNHGKMNSNEGRLSLEIS